MSYVRPDAWPHRQTYCQNNYQHQLHMVIVIVISSACLLALSEPNRRLISRGALNLTVQSQGKISECHAAIGACDAHFGGELGEGAAALV